MQSDLGIKMVRLRVAKEEAKDDARILAERKARREALLAEAAANPKPKIAGGMLTWFRGRRTITEA
jgi:hypothetical protein